MFREGEAILPLFFLFYGKKKGFWSFYGEVIRIVRLVPIAKERFL